MIDAVKAELLSLSEYRGKYVTRAALEAMLLADQTGAAMNESQDSSDAPAKSESNDAPAEKAETASSTSEAAASDDTGASTKAKYVLEQLRARAAAKKADAE